MHRLNRWLLSWFGAGFSPWAPGTVGSLAALPFAWAIAVMWGSLGLAIAAVIAFAVGWLAVSSTPNVGDDPGWIVIDEVAGQWLTLVLVSPDVILYSIGFLLFRAFDIFKPWPIRTLERRTSGGFGVMIDDVAAAIFAGAVLYGIQLGIGS